MGDARLLSCLLFRRGNTHEGNPARNLVRFTQTKKENQAADLTRLPRLSTYAHNSTICQLIYQNYQNFTYLLRIASRWYCTVCGWQCIRSAISS